MKPGVSRAGVPLLHAGSVRLADGDGWKVVIENSGNAKVSAFWDGRANGARQGNEEGFIRLECCVAIDRHSDLLTRLAGVEGQLAGSYRSVVITGCGIEVFCCEVDRHGLGARGRDGNGENEVGRVGIPFG